MISRRISLCFCSKGMLADEAKHYSKNLETKWKKYDEIMETFCCACFVVKGRCQHFKYRGKTSATCQVGGLVQWRYVYVQFIRWVKVCNNSFLISWHMTYRRVLQRLAMREEEFSGSTHKLLKKREKEPSPIQFFFGGGCPLETSTDTFLRFGQTDHSFFQFLILCSKTCCMYYIVSLVQHVSWCIDFSFLAQANLLSSEARVARRFTARICSSPVL